MTIITRRALTTYSAISLLLLCLLPCTATIGHCAAESKDPTAPRKLVAAIPADLPPTYFLDKSGKPVGFAVDVMNELARRTGLTVEYVSGQAFDDVIQMVLTGKADLIPSLTIDERRKELLAFTDTVGVLQANLFVASGNLTVQGISPGLTIGVVKGSSPEGFLMKNQTIRLTTFANPQAMLFELLAGHVDGVVFLTPNLMKLAIDAGVEDKIKVVGKPIIEAKRGIALRKEDTELITRLNKAIGEFVGSPEYRQIYIKWYGKPTPYWTVYRIGAVSGILLVLIVCGLVFWRYRSMVRLNNRLVLSIAERKQAEEALRESEERFRRLADATWEGIIIQREGIILDANESALKMFGYPAEEAIGKSVLEFLAPESKELALQKIKEGADASQLYFEAMGLRKDKTVFSIEILGRPIRYSHLDARVIAIRDTTERKRTEAELTHLNQQNELLLCSAAEGILGLDLQGKHTFINPAAARMLGYDIEELLGRPSHSTWHHTKPNGSPYPQEECEIYASYREGVVHRTSAEVFWRKDGTSFPVEYASTPIYEQDRPMGAVLTFADITERKRAEKQLQKTLESLRKAVGTTIQVLASAAEARDPYTAGHQIRSADLARTIAVEMGLPQDKIDGIRIAGSIHDIGKISIPAEILSKPTKLSEIEFALIKAHAQRGFEMLKDVESPWPLAEIVYQHHERMDGSGYPRNLKGEGILIEARILSVADVVEAMASHRPYRPGLGIGAALAEIEKNRGIFYDNAAVGACLRLFREKGFQLAGT